MEELRGLQVRAEGVVADVTSRDSLKGAALETIAKFGKVHLVCNNAGVGSGGSSSRRDGRPRRTGPGWPTSTSWAWSSGMETFGP